MKIYLLLLFGAVTTVVTGSTTPEGCKCLSIDDEWPAHQTWITALPGVVKTNGSDAHGTTVNYRLRVKENTEVQAAVKFVTEHNIRLAVITTGHDQLLRSDAGSGLLLDLSFLKGVEVSGSFEATEQGVPTLNHSTAPNTVVPRPGVQAVVTFGPAVGGSELNYALDKSGLFAIAGTAATVAPSGGWGLHGGYGPLSAQYGLGVDQWLEAKVVTADGELRIANAVSNPELFWAIRGGGGTFGVVVEATFKAYPTVPITGFNWYINSTVTDPGAINTETGETPVSAALQYLLGELPNLQRKGVSGYFYVSPSAIRGFSIHPGSISGTANANAVWAHILEKMQSFPGMTPFQTKPYNFKDYREFFDVTYGAWNGTWPPPEQSDRGIVPYQTRLLGTSHLRNPNITFALRGTKGNMGILLTAPGLAVGSGLGTSTTPAWREAIVHLVGYKSNATNIDDLVEISPEMGSYINEGSVNETNWSQSFWGDNYPRLSKIKKELDPTFTFWTTPGINADHMHVVDGRLCRTQNVSLMPSLQPPLSDRFFFANLEVDGDFLFGGTEIIGRDYPAPGTQIGLQPPE